MGVSGDCDPSTSIVGDGSPEKAQIARALRVAALVAASPDLAQTAIGAPAERRKDRRDPRVRGARLRATISRACRVSKPSTRSVPAPPRGTLASLAA